MGKEKYFLSLTITPSLHSSITPVFKFLGDHGGGETPVPIPNTEVKPFSADGTAWVTVWESRTLPRIKFASAKAGIEGPSEMMGLFVVTESMHLSLVPLFWMILFDQKLGHKGLAAKNRKLIRIQFDMNPNAHATRYSYLTFGAYQMVFNL